MQLLITPLAAFDLEEIGVSGAFLRGPLFPFLSIEKADRALGEDGTNDGHGTWLGL